MSNEAILATLVLIGILCLIFISWYFAPWILGSLWHWFVGMVERNTTYRYKGRKR